MFIVRDAVILGTVASAAALPSEPIAASITWPNDRSCVIVASSCAGRRRWRGKLGRRMDDGNIPGPPSSIHIRSRSLEGTAKEQRMRHGAVTLRTAATHEEVVVRVSLHGVQDRQALAVIGCKTRRE